MDIVGAIKAIFGALGELFGFFKDRQLLDAGEAKNKAKNDEAMLNAIEATRYPITDADRERVWGRLQAERANGKRLSADTSTRP